MCVQKEAITLFGMNQLCFLLGKCAGEGKSLS